MDNLPYYTTQHTNYHIWSVYYAMQAFKGITYIIGDPKVD